MPFAHKSLMKTTLSIFRSLLIFIILATVLPAHARIIPKSEPPPLTEAQKARIEQAKREGRYGSPFFKNQPVAPPQSPKPVIQSGQVYKTVPAIAGQEVLPGEPLLPKDPREGMLYVLLRDRKFQVYNRILEYYEVVTIPANTQLRLKEIITTRATYRQISYWLFTVEKLAPMSSNNFDHVMYDLEEGSEIWATHRIKPNDPLVDPLFPYNDIEKLTTDSSLTYKLPRAGQPLNFAIIPGQLWSPKCLKFIDEDGNLGVWGRTIYQKLSRADFARLLDEVHVKDLGSVCPAYKTFSKEDLDARKKLWVRLMASMAMSESGCRSGIEAQGPNGTLVGLLQLHKGKEHTYGKCPVTNSYVGTQNLSCGLNMLREQVDKHNALFVYFGQTYWDVLIRNRARAPIVKARVKALNSCKLKPSL